MLDAGASVEAQDGVEQTPLHRAAGKGHTETIIALVSAGASLEPTTQHGNKTPLDLARKEQSKANTHRRSKGSYGYARRRRYKFIALAGLVVV